MCDDDQSRFWGADDDADFSTVRHFCTGSVEAMVLLQSKRVLLPEGHVCSDLGESGDGQVAIHTVGMTFIIEMTFMKRSRFVPRESKQIIPVKALA